MKKMRLGSRIIFGFYFAKAVDETGRGNYLKAKTLLDQIYRAFPGGPANDKTPAVWDMLYSLVCLRTRDFNRSLELLNCAVTKINNRSIDLNNSNYLLAYAVTVFRGIEASRQMNVVIPPEWSIASYQYDLSQVRFNIRSTFPIKDCGDAV